MREEKNGRLLRAFAIGLGLPAAAVAARVADAFLFEPHFPRVIRFKAEIPDMDGRLGGLRLVHLSDLSLFLLSSQRGGGQFLADGLND